MLQPCLHLGVNKTNLFIYLFIYKTSIKACSHPTCTFDSTHNCPQATIPEILIQLVTHKLYDYEQLPWIP